MNLTKIILDGMIAKAEAEAKAEEKLLMEDRHALDGEGCYVEYTDNPLVSREDDPLGDIEASFDGKSLLIETEPSVLPVHHRWARRLEKKFKLNQKSAALFAYMVYAQLSGDSWEVRKHYESEITTQGFDVVSKEVRALFFEMMRLEPADSQRAFIGEGVEFRAIPVDVEAWERENPVPLPSEQEVKVREAYLSTISKIRRAGKHQIGELGKKLFEWSKKPEVRKAFGFEAIQEIWQVYNARKSQLVALA